MAERLAVVGDPIAHSLSPVMQQAALIAAGLDATYERRQVASADLAAWIEHARSSGYRGFNVTIPHKQTIRRYLDGEAESAARVGAVNTVVNDGGRLIGHNTDLVGFRAALLSLLPDPAGISAILFGAGGAARAVATVLAELGATLLIVNRSAEPARLLAASLRDSVAIAPHDESLIAAVGRAHLIVNATPLGMTHFGAASPLPAGACLSPLTVVMDLVYGRETPLLAQAREQGCWRSDGIEMLVQQGAESFRLWTGVEPDFAVMRAACREQFPEVQLC